MARRVNQVEGEFPAAFFVLHLDGVGLDRNALFTLQVHIIEHLRLHLAVGEGTGELQKTVGQGALAVVNMSDNAEISNVVHALHLQT